MSINSVEGLQNTKYNELLPYLAWMIVLIGTVGSLFFSEVLGYPPCALCWYQRIAMYPLVFIIGAGIIMRDWRMKYYALPLSLIGLCISIYHNLLYYGIISQAITPCTEGVSCTEKQIEWFGFITIPLMGLVSFLIVNVCLVLIKKRSNNE